MKKKLLYIGFAMLTFANQLNAQTPNLDSDLEEWKKNVVKLNLGGLAITAIPLQYERALHKNMSVALGVTFIPNRGLPGSISTDELQAPKFKGVAITPEFRFYPGKKEKHQAPHGFYLAPYFRYASYTLASPWIFTDTTGGMTNTFNLDLEAKFKSLNGGLMIGMQWTIKNRVSIDWWIAGFHGGTATPSFSIKGSDFALFDTEQKQELENDFEEMGESIPFVKSYDATVDNSGATLTVKMPSIGIRSGLCIGIIF